MIMQMLYNMQKTQKVQNKKLVFQNNRQKVQIYITCIDQSGDYTQMIRELQFRSSFNL